MGQEASPDLGDDPAQAKGNSPSLAIASISVFVSGLLALLVAEGALWVLAPIADPYERYKIQNEYIRQHWPPNLSVRTELEQGLPGVKLQNRFTTNNLGFRGPYLERPKPRDEHRIFMIGGSTTECLYLDDADSIERVLQEELNRRVRRGKLVAAYNAGRSGLKSDDHISMLAHRIVNLEPDTVIVFAGINDLTASILGFDELHSGKRGAYYSVADFAKYGATEFMLPRYGHSALKRLFSKTEEEVMTGIQYQSDYFKKIELCSGLPLVATVPPVSTKSYQTNLRSLIGICEKNDIRLVLMTQQTTWNSRSDPAAGKYHWMLCREGMRYSEESMDAAMEQFNDVMRDTAAEFGIPLYDLAARRPKSTEYFYDEVHFNVEGARRTAIELAEFLAEQDLVQ